jgi:multidrug efflux pump subunit AcrA (membrane-fusion protein)
MYGRATLILTDGAPGASHIPSAALVGRANDGSGSVRLLRDGKIVTVPVRFGMDDGVDVEILSGIGPEDSVVTSTNVPAADGTSATVSNGFDTPKVK